MTLTHHIYANENSSYIISTQGELFACGYNSSGKLGLGHEVEKILQFTRVTTLPADKRVIAVSAGSHHTLVLLEDNTLWGAGNNRAGALGLGKEVKTSVQFVLIPGLPYDKKIIFLACHAAHSIICYEDGAVFASGENKYGQLGFSHTEQRCYTFTPIDTLPRERRIVSLATSRSSTMVRLADGSLWGAGLNDDNQLGLNDTQPRPHFTRVSVAPIATAVSTVTTGFKHTLFILQDGSLWGAGSSQFGQLGLKDASETDRIPSLSGEFDVLLNPLRLSKLDESMMEGFIVSALSNGSHNILLTSQGQLGAMGNNNYYELGFAEEGEDNKRFILQYTQLVLPKHDEIYDVTTSDSHTMVQYMDGSICVAGYNYYGQLGFNDVQSRKVFTVCPVSPDILESKEKTLEFLSLQAYRKSLAFSPYLPGAFSKIANQINELLASEIFMPHLYGCSDCKHYVKPTVWGQCPYPHRLFSSPSASTSAAASGSTGAKLAKSDEVGPADVDRSRSFFARNRGEHANTETSLLISRAAAAPEQKEKRNRLQSADLLSSISRERSEAQQQRLSTEQIRQAARDARDARAARRAK